MREYWGDDEDEGAANKMTKELLDNEGTDWELLRSWGICWQDDEGMIEEMIRELLRRWWGYYWGNYQWDDDITTVEMMRVLLRELPMRWWHNYWGDDEGTIDEVIGEMMRNYEEMLSRLLVRCWGRYWWGDEGTIEETTNWWNDNGTADDMMRERPMREQLMRNSRSPCRRPGSGGDDGRCWTATDTPCTWSLHRLGSSAGPVCLGCSPPVDTVQWYLLVESTKTDYDYLYVEINSGGIRTITHKILQTPRVPGLLLLLCSPAISLEFTILGEIFAYETVLHSNNWGCHIPSSWMVYAGMFLLPAFTCLGHERQGLLSLCDGMNVCTVWTLIYTLIRKSFGGMESELMWTPRGKSPLLENSPQRKVQPATLHQAGQRAQHTYLLTLLCPSLPVEHRPSTTPAIALCSGLLLSFRTSWSPAVSALLQCLASNSCEASLSFSSPAGSRSELGVWCWMLASLGCVRSSTNSSAVSAWPLVPVPLTPTLPTCYSCRWCQLLRVNTVVKWWHWPNADLWGRAANQVIRLGLQLLPTPSIPSLSHPTPFPFSHPPSPPHPWLCAEVNSVVQFFFFFFFCVPQLYLWGSPLFGWDFCVCDRFLIQPLR